MDPPPGPQGFDLGSKLADTLNRCQITDEDRDKFFRSETLIKSIFDRLNNGGGVGELGEDDHRQRNGVMEDDSKNQEGDLGSNSGVPVDGDDAANIRNVEVGEEVQDHDNMIDRKGEKVEDDDKKTKELVENVKHEQGKEVEDDGMKSEEMKNNNKVDEEIEGGADTEWKRVDDYQTSSKETEKEYTIDEKIEETDAMEGKEIEDDITKLNGEMENPNDKKENVAEDYDGTNPNGTENGGVNDWEIDHHGEKGEAAEDHDSTINPEEISHDDQIQQENKGVDDEQTHKEIEGNGEQMQQEILGNDDQTQQLNEGNDDQTQHVENAEARDVAGDDDLRLMDDDIFPPLSRDVKIGKKEFRRLQAEWGQRAEPRRKSESTSNSSIKRVFLDYLKEPCLKE